MTINKTIMTCLFITLGSFISIQGQTGLEIPETVVLKTPEDYTKYDSLVIQAAKWVEETALDKETEKREKVNAFLMMWISGSPTVSIDINLTLAKLYGTNSELLSIYMASYTRHFLENQSTATKTSATKAGLISMMNVYKKGIKIKKTKNMEKLIKTHNKNKLDEYIKKYFS